MYKNRREEQIDIFNDTESMCKSDPFLSATIQKSNEQQYIVLEQDEVQTKTGAHRYMEPAHLVVSTKRSLEAASAYKGKKTMVHNFASATNPGGGVKKGSSAQEEAICRCSTLYFNISEPKIVSSFHDCHRDALKAGKMDATYNDDCIYTPGVMVFKTDNDHPESMDKTNWYPVDVITCAAPNLRERPSNSMNPGSGDRIRLKDGELKVLHQKRLARILDLAKAEGEEVVILGAFGCGAFQNPPDVVAEAMAETVESYLYDFEMIEFAVYCSPGDTTNYEVFKEKMQHLMR